MQYPGILFLIYFLPALLALYHALGFSRVLRDAVLLLAGLLFFAWGDSALFLILLGGTAANWIFGLLLRAPEERPGKGAKTVLVAAIVFNLGLLFFFKYLAAWRRPVNCCNFEKWSPIVPISTIANKRETT